MKEHIVWFIFPKCFCLLHICLPYIDEEVEKIDSDVAKDDKNETINNIAKDDEKKERR